MKPKQNDNESRASSPLLNLSRLLPEVLPRIPHTHGGTDNLDDLPELVLDSNWTLPSSKLPHWLVHDAGPELEALAHDLVGRVASEMGTTTTSTRAGEMRNEPGLHRVLRFVHRLHPAHASATDVILRSEGTDLYVNVQTTPRTMLTYLRWVWLMGMFTAAFASALTAYFLTTNAKQNWAFDYAQKNASARFPAEDKSDFVRRSVLEGHWQTDWRRVRDTLRAKPDVLHRYQHYLIEELRSLFEANDDPRRQEHASSPSRDTRPDSFAEARSAERTLTFEGARATLVALIHSGEYAPDLWFSIQAPNTTNNDQQGSYSVFDETRKATVAPTAEWDAFLEDLSYMQRGLGISEMFVVGFQRTHPLHSSLYLSNVDVPAIASMDHEEMARVIHSCSEWNRPWSYLGLLMADPRGGLTNVLAPCGIIGSIVGFFVWRSPKSWLRYPCRALGWMTPDDFNSEAIARNGRIIRLLSLTLQQQGYGREALTELGGVEVSA